MPSDLALFSNLIGSNYPCLELIFMVPKVFEPLKFYCSVMGCRGVVCSIMLIAAVGWFDGWLFLVLRLFETAFQSLSSRLPERGERKKLDRKEKKKIKTTQPTSTASIEDPCPAIIQISRTHRH